MEHILIQKMGEEIPKIKEKPIVMLIEGVDCAGKGFLIDALSKAYPSIIIKNTKRPANGNKSETIEYKRYIHSIMEFINHNRQTKTIILDRLFPSEMVYSKVKRGYEAFEDSMYAQFDKSLSAMPNLYIYCNPGYNTIVKRLKSRGDDYVNEGDVKALCERYDKFFDQTKMHKLNLDTSKPAEKMLEMIKQKINEYSRN